MLRKGKKYISAIFLIFCLASAVELRAQEPDAASKVKDLIEKGDALRARYRFTESLDAYEDALELTDSDSLTIQDRILMSENGSSMMGFVDIPNVVARKKFSIDSENDFL